MTNNIKLYKGDCLEILPLLPEKSVDFILTDPPYGTTACKWDSVIPLEPMWEQIWRVLRPNAAVALFSKQPFTSLLIASQLRFFKQELIWRKHTSDNPMQAKRRFLNVIENIEIFYKNPPTYNPQGIKEAHKSNAITRHELIDCRDSKGRSYTQKFSGYPNNVLNFKKVHKGSHPTQKPVDLLEYLIKTYTQEGETVLDFTMGSGSTGVACQNTNRNFIGIEQEEKYMDIAIERMGLQKT